VATGSRVTSSKPAPVDAESSKDKEQQATEEKKSVQWGNLFADIYPLIKIMEVQVCYRFLLRFVSDASFLNYCYVSHYLPLHLSP